MPKKPIPWWFSELPPTSTFTLNWLACDEDLIWYEYDKEPEIVIGGFISIMGCCKQMDPGIMPVLKCGEWKKSKTRVCNLAGKAK